MQLSLTSLSSTETRDLALTCDTRYMSIDYHLADLAQKIFTPDIAGRKESLIRSQEFYERFLKLLDSYDLLSRPDAKLYESYTEDKRNFSTVSTKDAAARRDIKIARFKEEKELKRKLEVRITLGSEHAPS
jgi:immunoglobulin-binding protein 1